MRSFSTIVISFAGLCLSNPGIQLKAQTSLDHYIQDGLANNLVLQTRAVALDKSLLALKEARSLYLPTTWLEGSYTLANGGRNISIPVGDLLNPVYQTLNQLTGTEKFPTVSNVNEQLLPNNFYDLRVRTTVPVYNRNLGYNREIRSTEVRLKENEVRIYKRELIRDIKTAYYTYLMAHTAIGIYEQALTVVGRNLAMNQSLLQNGKGLPAYVSRAESEKQMVEAQVQQARNERDKARAFFNALLNRAAEDSVVIQEAEPDLSVVETVYGARQGATAREELQSMKLQRDIQTRQFQMNKSFRSPQLNFFLDLAAQDFDFRVKSNSFFYLGGLQLTVPIYAGNRNLYKIRQSELDLKENELQTGHVQRQLELGVFTSRNNVHNHYVTLLAHRKQEEAARQYFKLIDRGYREGIHSFIELLDARNQMTQSQIQEALSRYRLLAALADYERASATYPIQ